MKNYILLIIFFFCSLTFAQKSPFIGCENPKGRDMKTICKSKNFPALFSEYMYQVIRNYKNVPEGRAKLKFVITSKGEMSQLSYSDTNNEAFAKLALTILQNIQQDFHQYKIFFIPIREKETNQPINFTYEFPIYYSID